MIDIYCLSFIFLLYAHNDAIAAPPASPLLQRPVVSRLSQTFGAAAGTKLCEPSYMFPLTWHFVQGFIGKLRIKSFLAFFVFLTFSIFAKVSRIYLSFISYFRIFSQLIFAKIRKWTSAKFFSQLRNASFCFNPNSFSQESVTPI
jgi:hypothetical protein